MEPNRLGAVTAGLTVLVALAACGGDSEETSSSASTSAQVSGTSTSFATTVPATAPATSPPASTAPETTSPTTAPVTTAPPETTQPPTDTGPSSGPATAIAMDGFDLVERDVVTGAVVRTLVEGFTSEATYPSDFTLDQGRTRLFFDEFSEDSWFTCELSPGSVHVVDLATGVRTGIGPGTSPSLSRDGAHLAYLAASRCIPDPDEPQFVITPYDTVVLVDLVGGERVEHRLATPPERWDAPEALSWVGFDDDGSLLVATNTGDLHRIAAADLAAPVEPTAGSVIVDLVDARPVEAAAGRLIATVIGAEGSEDVYAIDLASTAADLLVTSEYPILVGVSDDGTPVVGYDTRDTPPPGLVAAEVAALVPIEPGGGLSVVLGGIDW